MNKKLIAVAVAGAFAAPLAAQADVTIYGKMHISLDWFMDAQSDKVQDPEAFIGGIPVSVDNSTDGLAVSSNFSRIGFKGSEDLGSDLKAIWQVEQEVDIDDGGGNWASRNSFLGLASGFGTVLAGRHDSPMKDVGRKIDIFGDTVGDIRALTDLANAASPGWDQRLNNLIAYISPDFAGLKFFGAYSTDVISNFATADNNDRTAWSASLSYQTGPIYAAVAYEQHNLAVLDTVSADVEDDSENAVRVAVAYTFGAFKVGGMWQKTDGFFSGATTDTTDRDVFDAFVQYAFGATSIGLQWTMADESDEDDTGIQDDGAQLWSLGLFHNLSKRTQVYAMYSLMDNDENGNFAIGGGRGHGEAYLAGIDDDGDREDPQVFSVGVIHSF